MLPEMSHYAVGKAMPSGSINMQCVQKCQKDFILCLKQCQAPFYSTHTVLSSRLLLRKCQVHHLTLHKKCQAHNTVYKQMSKGSLCYSERNVKLFIMLCIGICLASLYA